MTWLEQSQQTIVGVSIHFGHNSFIPKIAADKIYVSTAKKNVDPDLDIYFLQFNYFQFGI